MDRLSRVGGEVRVGLDLIAAQRGGAGGLARRQQARLRTLLHVARSRSPVYRRLYGSQGSAVPALQDLPPVTKPGLMAQFDDWVTDPAVTLDDVRGFLADPDLVGTPYRGRYFACTSSGTTGHPGFFLYDRRSVTVFRAMMLARVDVNWLSVADLGRLAGRRFRWAAVVGAGTHYAGAGWMQMERNRSRWRSRSYRVVGLDVPLAEIVDELNDFQPGILTTYPSVLRMLADERRAGRLQIRPVFIETSGETTDPVLVAEAQRVFGCPVHDAYACSEFLFLAFGCRHGWLHVNSDWVVLEPVDEQGRPVEPGVASDTVLLTNLVNHVQPLIRYELGDSVISRPDPCPCGLALPAMRVVSRRDDVMRLADGRGRRVSVAPLAIGSVVEQVPGVHRFQLIQHEPSAMRVRLQVRSGVDGSAVREQVRLALGRYLADIGLGNVTAVDDLSPPRACPGSGKFRQVVVEPAAAGLAQ